MNRLLKRADGTAFAALALAVQTDSEPINMAVAERRGRASVNLAWTGGGTGTFQLLVSNDDTSSSSPSAASLALLEAISTSEGSPIHRDLEIEAACLVVRYVPSAGSINLTARVNSNGWM